MIDLALDINCKFQILIQMMAESELGEALIIFGFDTKVILLNICNSLNTFKMISKEIAWLVFSE